LQEIGTEDGEFTNVDDNEDALELALEDTLTDAAKRDYN
jgi:hypothetical protein